MISRRVKFAINRAAKPIFLPMDTSGQAFPKPGPAVRPEFTKDGRLIEKPHRYRITKYQMWVKQNQRCANPRCRAFMPTPAYGNRHHPGGRGIGGSKRDDSITILLCLGCHRKEHGK